MAKTDIPVKYQALTNEHGAAYATFEYEAYDGALYGSAKGVITINVDYVATTTAEDKTLTMDEDTVLGTVADYGFSDLDGDSLAKVVSPIRWDLWLDEDSDGTVNEAEPAIAADGEVLFADLAKWCASPEAGGDLLPIPFGT